MRRLRSLFLPLLSLAAAPALHAQTAAAPTDFVSAPGGGRLATLRPGASVSTAQANGGWREATITGWVPESAVRQGGGGNYPLVVKAAAALHADPGGLTVATLAGGMVVAEVERRDGWVRIRRSGFVRDGGSTAGAASTAAPSSPPRQSAATTTANAAKPAALASALRSTPRPASAPPSNPPRTTAPAPAKLASTPPPPAAPQTAARRPAAPGPTPPHPPSQPTNSRPAVATAARAAAVPPPPTPTSAVAATTAPQPTAPRPAATAARPPTAPPRPPATPARPAAAPARPPAPAVRPAPVATTVPARKQPVVLHATPGGGTVAVVDGDAPVQVLARDGEWTRVRVEGWTRSPVAAGASAPGAVTLRAIDADPDAFRGREVEWTLRFVSLQTADALRTDFTPGESFILARDPNGETGFVYVAVAPELLPAVRRLAPFQQFRMAGRIRVGRSPMMGHPIVDLLRVMN